MMKKWVRFFTVFLLIAAMAVGYAGPCFSADDEAPDIDAKAAILMDADSGNVLYALNEDTPLFTAGLSVMMTALLAAEAEERGDVAYDDVVVASAASHSDVTEDASIQNIVPGEEMSLEDLLACILIGGASEACNIVAEHVGGSIGDFVKKMNARAAELGCTGTNFVNAHGLPADRNYSTAYDMALIASQFVKHDKLIELANTVAKTIPATNVSGERSLTSTNYILRQDYTRYYYSYACGIKSSYTEDAGFCLASSMKADGSYVVSIVLGCRILESDNGFYDVQSFIQTRRLFQWFNSRYSLRDVISTIEPITEIPVQLAEGTDTVVCCSLEGLRLFLPTELNIKDTYKRVITIYSQEPGAEPLTAPVTRGQVLGELRVTDGKGGTYGPFPLVANTDVAVSRVELMRRRLGDLVKGKWFRTIFWIVVAVIALYAILVIRYRILRMKERRARRKARRRELEAERDESRR